MAERDGYGYEGWYEIFSTFIGFIDVIFGLIPSKIKAIYLIEENKKVREDREEKEMSRSRGMLSPSQSI